MFLIVDASTVPVQRPVEAALFALGEVATIACFVGALTLGDVRQVSFIASFLLGADLAASHALLNTLLLVIQPLIDSVNTRVIRNGTSLRECRS